MKPDVYRVCVRACVRRACVRACVRVCISRFLGDIDMVAYYKSIFAEMYVNKLFVQYDSTWRKIFIRMILVVVVVAAAVVVVAVAVVVVVVAVAVVVVVVGGGGAASYHRYGTYHKCYYPPVCRW